MTTSFHHGTEHCFWHNNRSEKSEKEKHIDPDGWHETWIEEPIEKAYERLFGEALNEYNERQKRSDRKIKNYLQNVRQNSKLNDCYEFIVQIGNEKNHPDAKTSHIILDEYFKNFLSRNEGLEVIGAYFHADEVGGTPHLHVDYIPVAQGKKTGLKVRNNLNSALKNLGYETEYVDGKMNSAEMQFQNAEREALNEICRSHGIEIENPNRKDYCSSKQLREARNVRLQNETRHKELSEREEKLEHKEKNVSEREEKLTAREEEVSSAEKNLNARQEIVLEHEKEYASFKKDLDEYFEKYAGTELKNYRLVIPDFSSKLWQDVNSADNVKKKFKFTVLSDWQKVSAEVAKFVVEKSKEFAKPFQDEFNKLQDRLHKATSVIKNLSDGIKKLSKDNEELTEKNAELTKKVNRWRQANPAELREIADMLDESKCQSWQQLKDKEKREQRKNRSSGFER